MRSYSVAAFKGVNNKTSSNLYTVLSSNTTEERFNSRRRAEGRDLYLTEIISDMVSLFTSSTALESAAILT